MDGPEFRSPPKRIVLGNLNQNGGSPISPMANLKLLTKVATSHFSVGENNQFDDVLSNKNNSKDNSKPSRRFRSLSFICKKFLLLYKLDIPVGENQPISLGNLAVSLGIEKRRVYDIINVVSSLHMAVKVCKDRYSWYGNQNLPALLSQLKAYALINKVDEQINSVLQNQILYSASVQESESRYIKITRGDRSVFEENRIGVLCQKFIMLFLVCNNDIPLNMCTISKLILTGDAHDKTGMRRLYDIANVLEALDLIKRYQCKIMKKPSFKYCGPEISLNPADCERLVPITLPCMNQIQEGSDLGDTNSDSSLDCVNNSTKFDFILEAACAEFQEENNTTLSSPISVKKRLTNSGLIQCNARKQLFPSPYVVQSVEPTDSFIKAPKQSFRLSFNELQVLNSVQDNNNVTSSVVKKMPVENQCTTNFSANFNRFGRLEEKFNVTINRLESSEKDGIIETVTSNCNESASAEITNNAETRNKSVMFRNVGCNQRQSVLPTKVKVLRPMKLSDIQNGGIYKVLKKGNTVQLYAL